MSADHGRFTVRLAGPGDAEALARVHVESRRHAYRDLLPPEALAAESVEARRAMWDERLGDPCGRCWVATVAAELEPRAGALAGGAAGQHRVIVGLAHTGRARDEELGPETAELFAIYVAPAWTGVGAGRALVARVLEDLAERGFCEVVLWVAAENTAAWRFYRSAGFAPDPRRPAEPFGDTGLSRVRMRSVIPPVRRSLQSD